ncbi:MAG: FecR domain-containing protein [Deltaproteobacteria bacterium]|nr:FecR domain-containing protein [Deltaproteobacteria bacterium]
MAAEKIMKALVFLMAAVLVAAGWAVPTTQAAPAPATQASIGSIAGMSGTVYFKPRDAAKWAVAAKGVRLDAGDRIKTGSDGRAALRFKDNSNITLGNDTELEITEFLLKKGSRSAVYSVSTGKLRAAVGKFSGRTDIKVKTPTSVSGVKGTDFIVMNQGDANIIFGEESNVQVSGDNGRPVVIKPNTMTENTRGTAPIHPEKVEPGTPLADVRAQLETVTNVDAPVEWEKAGQLPLILARWNINYGRYLAESKRFADALDVFQISVDLTEKMEIRAEAYLERGTLLSRNMNEPQRALAEYMIVIEKYPEPQYLENAIFSAGMINRELGDKENAKKLFERYLNEYPNGRHKETVENLMKEM